MMQKEVDAVTKKQSLWLGYTKKRLSVYKNLIQEYGVKRTNIEIDEDLVENCMKATGIKTRKALIDHALQELLRHENQMKILELKGKVSWEGNLNEWRERRST